MSVDDDGDGGEGGGVTDGDVTDGGRAGVDWRLGGQIAVSLYTSAVSTVKHCTHGPTYPARDKILPLNAETKREGSLAKK